jgi:hypothetical protein
MALLFNPSLAMAADSGVLLDDYHAGLATGWQEKVFRGRTDYRTTIMDGRPCIAAESTASASGLVFAIDFAPQRLPILSWEWRIEDVIATADATRKSGDDYPARVYVVFPSPLFWRTKAVNYIWDNRLAKETILKNAYTKNAMMIVVESGPAKKGVWVREERDVRQDFIRAFGEEPPPAGAIAIMTDTDDTGETARAWYGPIRLMAKRGRY